MERTLHPVTQRMLGRIPTYWRNEPIAQAILDALGREVQRLQDVADAIRLGLFPQLATDTVRGKLLSLQEKLYDVPVAQPGQTEAQRRNLVLAHLRGRNASSGLDWLAAMSQAMGSTVWTYQEGPAAYTITIYIPFGVASYNSVQVQQFARKITPAHLDIAVVYSSGFIVGEGIVGEDRL